MATMTGMKKAVVFTAMAVTKKQLKPSLQPSKRILGTPKPILSGVPAGMHWATIKMPVMI